ncbi:MAG TPA: type II toxin-antitoxin system VapC family toxin [Candidatus Xenobia bacterium]|jgi:ribonuclease VapC
MVIDSSALVAILMGESEAGRMAVALARDPKRLVAAVSVLETAMVLETKKGPAGGREVDLLLHHARIEVVAMSVDQVQLARQAWLRFGKGRHPAGLNLGDCCSYALAVHSGEPLLFKGADFNHTDVAQAAW